MTLAAIVLAGGAASRLGGVDKPALLVGGSTLLERAVAAARSAGCEPIVVVGPPRDVADVTWVREEPAGGGPVAAIAAALPLVSTTHVLVLAADVPREEEAVARLLARADGDAACLVDERGRPQWLLGRYATALLRAAVTRVGDVDGASMRRLLDGVDAQPVPASDALVADVDTWEDLARARSAVAAASTDPSSDDAPREEPIVADQSRTLPPEALDAWAAALATRLGLAPEEASIVAVLDLARDVAHGVARPAAPLSAFMVGLAAGRAGGEPQQVADAMRAATDLAAQWRDEPPTT